MEILCHAYAITVPGGLRVPLIKLAQSAGPTSNYALQCFLNSLSLIMTENPALDHDKNPDVGVVWGFADLSPACLTMSLM